MNFTDVGSWGYGSGTQELLLPPGNHYIDDSVLILKRMGAVISGSGIGQTRLVWRGGYKPIFCSASSRRFILKNLTLAFETPCLSPIVITNSGTDGPYFSTQNVIDNVFIDGNNKIDYGIVVDGYAYGGNGHNCEHHLIQDCVISGAKKAGIAILSNQAHRCMIRRNEIRECSVGMWLSQASQTVEDNHGGECGMYLLAGQCFRGPLVFDRNNTENNRRAIHLIPSSGSEKYLIRNNGFDGMYAAPIINRADQNNYTCVLAGNVEMSGNTFGSRDYPPSYIFVHTVANTEITRNELATNTAPVINRIHDTGVPWGSWRLNTWQDNKGKSITINPIESNLNTTPQQPAGTPWPKGIDYPDWLSWLSEWRLLTANAELPQGVLNWNLGK